MNFFKRLTQRILFGDEKAQRLDMIMQRGDLQSLEDYLFLFPGACPECGYRQVVDCEEKGYVSHRHGLPVISMQTWCECTRCHHRWDRSKKEWYASLVEEEEMEDDWPRKETPRRITSPYLPRKQSDAIPEFPLV
jgi:hypothetical protein